MIAWYERSDGPASRFGIEDRRWCMEVVLPGLEKHGYNEEKAWTFHTQ